MNTLPADWKKCFLEHTKAYKRILEKGPKNKILDRLPALHEAALDSFIGSFDERPVARVIRSALSSPILSGLAGSRIFYHPNTFREALLFP